MRFTLNVDGPVIDMPLILSVQAWPAWIALAVSFLVAANRLLDESERFAKIFGGFGKRIHSRAVARRRVESVATEFAVAVEDAVDRARAKWKTDENDAIRALDNRLASIRVLTTEQSEEIAGLRLTVRCLTAYTEYEAAWHHRLTMLIYAVSGGLTPQELPPHMDHWQFRALFIDNQRWQKWGAGLAPEQ